MYFLYPFTYWCPVGLFPSLGYCEQCCQESELLFDYVFSILLKECLGVELLGASQVVLVVKNLQRVGHN